MTRKRKAHHELFLRQGTIATKTVQLFANVSFENQLCKAKVFLPSNYPITDFSKSLLDNRVVYSALFSVGNREAWNWKLYDLCEEYTHTIRLHYFERIDKCPGSPSFTVALRSDEQLLFKRLGVQLVSKCLELFESHFDLPSSTTGIFLEASGSVRNEMEQKMFFDHSISKYSKKKIVRKLKQCGINKTARKTSLLEFYRKELISQAEQEALIRYYKSNYGLLPITKSQYCTFMGNGLQIVKKRLNSKWFL